MSCCDSRDDRVLRVFPEEESGTSYINTAYSLLQNVVSRQQGQHEAGGSGGIKEKVIWTKIDRWIPCRDCVNNAKLNEAAIHRQPFFLITIALENSLQLWILYSHGASDLVCSLGGEDIRIFQHLTCPKKGCRKRSGPLAIKVSANVGLEVASLLNLRSFDEIEKIQLPKSILGTLNNENYIALAVPEEIFVYSNDENFTKLFSISPCYYDPSLNINPMALGTQWLAFADARLVHRYECGGGVSVDMNSQLSYTSVLVSAAQTLGRGMISIAGSITAALTRSPANVPGMTAGSLPSSSPDLVGDSPLSLSAGTPPAATYLSVPEQNGHYMSLLPQQTAKNPGVVTIINCAQFANSRGKTARGDAASGLVAHFPAHTGAPLAFLQFSTNGSLLASADTTGREFNVFRILVHPASVSLAAVHHLYSLHRGDTTATVVEMSFSPDSRWLVVGTHRGTAHVFPITPYGGTITRRTHCRKLVPNRFSRFHQSAGLDSLQTSAPKTASQSQHNARTSQPPVGSPKMSHIPIMPGGMSVSGMATMTGALGFIGGSIGPASVLSYPSRLNSRLPPYPHPVSVRALYQIKQILSIPGLDLVNPSTTTNGPASFGTTTTTISSSLPSNSSNSMASLSLAVNSIVPSAFPTSISMAFSPIPIYRAPSQLISAATSLNSLSGSGLSTSLGAVPKPTAQSPASTTLCLITWQGDLIEYKLSPHVSQNIPPEKLGQDSPVELDVETVARWPLVANLQAAGSIGGVPGPLYSHVDVSCVCPCAIVFNQASPGDRKESNKKSPPKQQRQSNTDADGLSGDGWISQVETFTCTSPSRRLWSGPQFSVQSYDPGPVDSAGSSSPSTPSVPSSSATGDSVGTVLSRTSFSTSPIVCQSEDSAFGDQDRPISPPLSSESGSLTTLPQIATTKTCPVDIQAPQKSQKSLGKNKKKHKATASVQAVATNNVQAIQAQNNININSNNNNNNNNLAVLEAYSGPVEVSSDGKVETELLAAAVQDLQF